MRALLLSLLPLAATACGSGVGPSDTNATAQSPDLKVEAVWPDGLRPFGDGYPNAGDNCRRVGESAATSDLLDDSADLIGCPSNADARVLGGTIVGTVGGVTLVSVPIQRAASEKGKRDALVPGTDFQATADIPCTGVAPGKTVCTAGVRRGPDQIAIEVSLPDGRSRSLLFDGKGKFVTVATAQSDGTAAWKISSRREGDWTIIIAGPETYRVPDAFVLGD